MKPILKNPKVLNKLIFQMIEEHIEDFLAYLDINRSMFFSSEWEYSKRVLMMWNNTCRQKLPKCFLRLFATLRNSEVKQDFKIMMGV